MAELSPEGEDLVRAGREADRPSDADRERVMHALEARLGLAMGGASAPAKPGRLPVGRAAHGALARWAAVGLASMAGAALLYALHGIHQSGRGGGAAGPARTPTLASAVVSEPPQAPAPDEANGRAPAAAAARSNEANEAPGRTPAADTAEAQRPTPSNNARPSGGTREPSRLSEEVALLSRAETDLHAGRFESALRALDEHERRFPHGALEQDRMAARAQALCALGRTAEAQVPLERLARTAPNSPNEERARQACRADLGAPSR